MKKFSKKQPIGTIKDGTKIDDIFVVKIKKFFRPYKNGFYFELLISDASGQTINYRYWGGQEEQNVRALYDSIENDSVVHIQGMAKMYNGAIQISTNEPDIIEALEPGQYDEWTFIKPSQRDIDEMFSELTGYIGQISDTELRRFVQDIFSDNEIKEKFKVHPAAIEVHHNWKGGLLQHTLEILKYCELSAEIFPILNKDLLIAGGILHDIGKLREIAVTSRIKGTKKGQLKGHIVMGFAFIYEKLKNYNINENMKDKLLHIILSHHGEKQYGSPKEPMIPEAVVIHHADAMSAKITEIIQFVEQSKKRTEDEFMYNKRKGLNIFLR